MIFYRRIEPVQAMTFDLDDTLYDNHPVIRLVEEQAAKWLHTHHSVSASQPIIWWQQMKQVVASQDPMLVHDMTKWRYEQIFQGLRMLGYSEEQALQAAGELINEVLRLRNQVDVPDETHRVMAQLADRIPLIAITNGNADPDKFGLGHYFQAVLKAGPDGLSKPFPDLFNKAQAMLNIPAGRILHIGDHLRTDVQGAKMNGFQACWLNDTDTDLRHCTKARILPDVEIARLSQLLELPFA